MSTTMKIFRKGKFSASEIEKNAATIDKIMKATGWSKRKVIKAVEETRTRIPRVGFYGYLHCELYNVASQDQKPIYEEYTAQRKKDNDSFVKSVCEKTGWTYDDANSRMKKTYKNHGVTYREYHFWNLFDVPEDQIDELVANKRQLRKERKLEGEKEAAEDNEAAIVKAITATGLTREAVIAKIDEASNRTGCSKHEYGLYKMWDIDEQTQNTMFFRSLSKKLTKKYNIDKVFIDILFDKEASNIYFNKYMKRAWCVNTKISEDEFVEKFRNSEKIFYKPIDGHHGDGARPYVINGDNIHDIYKEVADLSEGVIEEYVVQHHAMSGLAPGAVNTLRVATISSNENPVTEDGKHIDIAYISLKMAGVDSVVDNLVNGGMVAGVDMETGKLITKAIDIEGNTYDKHPVTGTDILGFQIPFFDEVRKLVDEVYEDKKIEGYLGWDIAITEDGPIIIEVNTTPGVILLQYPYVPERKGMKAIMEKYL